MAEDNKEVLFALSETEIREAQKTLERFIKKYKENPEREPVEWLREQLTAELPDKSKEEIKDMAEDIVSSVSEYECDLKDLTEKCRNGKAKEAWFAEKLQDSAKAVSIEKFGSCLNQIDQTLVAGNEQMARIALSPDSKIISNVNIEGFMAEQYHVNDFNAKAVLQNSPYRARVCGPEDGIYSKNSADVVIDNIKTGQAGVARYRFMIGKDADATSRMVNAVDKGQRIVVPLGQQSEVLMKYPDRRITDYIGGTEEIDIISDPLTKAEIGELHKKVQESGYIPEQGWNTYTTKRAALNIGKSAGSTGVKAALLGTVIGTSYQILNGEKIETDEVIEKALKTGSDTCVKCAASGALKVASEKGVISILPPGTPAGTLAKLACVAVEDVKILLKVAQGKITMSEAMELMGRTNVAMYAGLTVSVVGAGIGAAALSFIPFVGPIIGGLIGGTIGYMAGSKFGEQVFEGAKKVCKKGRELIKRGYEKVKSAGRKVKDAIRNILPF